MEREKSVKARDEEIEREGQREERKRERQTEKERKKEPHSECQYKPVRYLNKY